LVLGEVPLIISSHVPFVSGIGFDLFSVWHTVSLSALHGQNWLYA
jgi:hypothetical protein